jgi:hypothetical protein
MGNIREGAKIDAFFLTRIPIIALLVLLLEAEKRIESAQETFLVPLNNSRDN